MIYVLVGLVCAVVGYFVGVIPKDRRVDPLFDEIDELHTKMKSILYDKLLVAAEFQDYQNKISPYITVKVGNNSYTMSKADLQQCNNQHDIELFKFHRRRMMELWEEMDSYTQDSNEYGECEAKYMYHMEELGKIGN